MTKWNSAHSSRHSNAPYDFANRRMRRNQRDCRLNLGPESVAQAGALSFVPSDVVSEVGIRFVIRSYRLHQRPKMSLSIRARTSFQSELASVPASMAAHLRSIFAAQASSTSRCASGFRLSRIPVAISARSFTGRLRTCSSRAAVSFISVRSLAHVADTQSAETFFAARCAGIKERGMTDALPFCWYPH